MRAGPTSPTAPEPLVVIDSGVPWGSLDLREVRRYHELLYFLTVREIKLRYKQTVLGAAWAILQPLSGTAVFSLFLGRVGGLASHGVPYPVFVFAGLLVWTYFSNAVTAASNSLVGSTNLITKVYFPRILLPAAPVLAGLVDLAIACALMLGLMAYFGLALTSKAVALPALFALLALFAFGIGSWAAALNVRYRDVRHALPFIIQLWLFASPIIYPVSFVPERWRWVLTLNPVAGIVEGVRTAFLGRGDFDWPALAAAAAVTALTVVCAVRAFARAEHGFADVI